MLDKYKRTINYMRISLTDRCNLRCAYCRPENAKMVEHAQILRYEEILRIAQCVVTLGITNFKITGGEPLVRKDAVDFITKLKQMEGVEQVTLTTNGTLLAASLPKLLACSLDGINISLDTVDKDFYSKITGGGELEAVTKSIKAAVQSGLRCKINCVPLKNNCTNSNHLLALLQFARNLEIPLRFIELMPMGPCAAWDKSCFLSAETVLQRYSALQQIDSQGVARRYRLPGAVGTVGLISPVSHAFCGQCSRIRVTADGRLKGCLHSAEELSLRGLHGEALEAAIRRGILQKPRRHHLAEGSSGTPRTMNQIGG